MTAAASTVALASFDRSTRAELARYLEASGFGVAQSELPPEAFGGGSLVWLAERDLEADVAETVVTSWLARGPRHRVVIVTWRPAALRELLDRHPSRMFVLTPPVFGWQVVDALRASGPGEPSAA